MAIIRNFRLPSGIGVSADYIETYGVIESLNTNTGSVVARGGMGVSGNIYLGGNLSIGSTVISGAWAGTAITGRFGGTGYTTYTKGDLLVGVGSTLVKVGIGSSHQVLSYSPSATSGLGWTDLSISSPVSLNYGAFYSNATQPVLGANTITPITVNNTYEAANIEIYGGAGTSSRIRILNGGVFNIQFSVQMNLSQGTQPSVADFWFRVNGTDVPQSNTHITVLGKDFESVITINFVYTFANNDYFEILMSSADPHYSIEAHTGLTSPPRPDIPSIILSVLPVTHIVGASGSGISGILSINGSTSSQQYFLTGRSGNDFNIQTGGGSHTFNIPYASTGSTGLVNTLAQSFAGVKTFTNDTIISSPTASTSYTSGALTVAGGVGIGGTLNVQGDLNVQGTFTTINSTTITVADKNIELGVVASPSDLTAQGGGITLRGATDKSLNWYSGVGWSSSESFNLVSGNTFKINGTSVLSATSLGTGVTNSNLTAVATVTTGVWAATAITAFYGGTGYNSYTKGDILVGAGSTFIKLNVGTDNYVLTALSTASTGLTWSPTAATGLTTLNGLNVGIQYFATGISGSGFNISSSGSTHTFNIPIAGTGATGLVSTLAQTFTGAKTFDTTLTVSATTPSTNYSSGALIVAGGAGFAGTIYTQTDLNVGNSTTGRLFFSQATLGSAGTTVIPSMAFIGATNSPITLSVLADNSLSFDGSSGQLFSINNNLSTGWIFAVNDISGLPLLRANADGTVAMGEFAGNIGIGLSNPSYKLHVVGDTNLSSSYVYRINGTSVLTATSLGTGVTNSSLTAVGTITTGTWSATAITAFYGGTGYQSYTVGDLLVGAGSTLYKLPVGTNNYVLTADNTAPGGVKWSVAASTGVTTINALTESIQYFAIGTSGSGFNISSSGSTHTFNIPIASTGSTGLVSTLAQSFAGIKTFTNDLVVSSSTVSTSTSTGALTVTGGVGIGGSLYTGTSTADSISGVVLNNGVITSGSWSATAITAFYGGTGNTSYTLGDLLVGAGSTFIKLPVGINSYVLGADSSKPSGVGWTSVTPLTISDTPPASPKNADLWFNSLDGGLLVYYSDVDTNQWVEIALGSGIDLTQPVHITNTTASTSTSTGALIVDGGAGFASTIYAPVISINGIYDQISSTLTTSSTTADQVAMSLGATVYRTLKLNVQMTSSTSYHSQEILMVHDGTLVYMTEYAIVNNGSILSTFDADISGGNIRLLVSPTNAVTTYKIACSAIRI